MSSCAVCRREPVGFLFSDPVPMKGDVPIHYRACSMAHLAIIHDAWKCKEMDILTKHEAEAVRAAIPEIGEAIEAIGKSDLATMTPAEFEHVLSVAFTATANQLGRIVDEMSVPF
jgi:hypothetical protein